MYWGDQGPYHAEKAVCPRLFPEIPPFSPMHGILWLPLTSLAARMDDVQDKEGGMLFRQEAGSGSR